MNYPDTIEGLFLERPNRFIARVLVDGKIETAHVKNTGRCRELLLPNSKVILQRVDSEKRKTQYDLIAVWKEGLDWVNIDSQVPNLIMKDWLMQQDFDYIKPEYRYGGSRIDFYMEKNGQKYLLEVKGCTLEIDRIGYFPDAPTVRGTKHIMELTCAALEGYKSVIAFVIALPKVCEVRPNASTDPDFANALAKAKEVGVEIWYMPCKVDEGSIEITECIKCG